MSTMTDVREPREPTDEEIEELLAADQICMGCERVVGPEVEKCPTCGSENFIPDINPSLWD